ncbi:phosphoribosylanthranilate isomerase [Kordiimonas sp. SCSIO 12610]|uniref:phosphoribosylanthranilate isomerase n=1 Tax=Kordiimonas sp. SCSIO 12610 TaxID=2829597 RepID=UPI00210D2E53|nr:phosphoribosylanthranilate isomerase [Kordiimonas sp. SCSIO 12610]UTW55216.1 phosphoribosylanthranilate isomerase [Kordiimonas sp. SCSIO 12610]
MSIHVKICGITDAETANIAAKAGARWLGFVFFEASPRDVSLQNAMKMRPRLPSSVERVGVFVDAPFSRIEAAVDALDLDYVQLHGLEYPSDAKRIRDQLGVSVIKAYGIREENDLDQAAQFDDVTDLSLYDAKPPRGAKLPGGNAISFPWRIMQTRSISKPWLLAGGLTSVNLQEAIEASGAAAVDISSGVESAPGVKSHEKIQEFLNAAKAIT